MDSTPLSTKVLSSILETRGWDQLKLADLSDINRATVSLHVNGTRAIRDDHLAAYCKALSSSERAKLVAAWLRDTLDHTTIESVLDDGDKLNEPVRTWRPGLDPEQQEMIVWWIQQLAIDAELDDIFRAITRKAGFEPAEQSTPITTYAGVRTGKAFILNEDAIASMTDEEVEAAIEGMTEDEKDLIRASRVQEAAAAAKSPPDTPAGKSYTLPRRRK